MDEMCHPPLSRQERRQRRQQNRAGNGSLYANEPRPAPGSEPEPRPYGNGPERGGSWTKTVGDPSWVPLVTVLAILSVLISGSYFLNVTAPLRETPQPPRFDTEVVQVDGYEVTCLLDTISNDVVSCDWEGTR